ncbi:MAG: ESPR-type extended signal peptide-containing protein, partial [Mariprofundaceae bacterium]
MNSKFNRNYRVLWNESIKQWVVADELSTPGGKGKSRGAVSRILSAALIAGSMMAANPQEASALTATGGLLIAGKCAGVATSISATFTGTCTATATDSLTLTNTGSISAAPGPGISVISVDAAATGVTIDNSGKLLKTNRFSSVISVKGAARGTTIVNRAGGLISNAVGSATAIQFGSGSFDAGSKLTNHGIINVSGTNRNSATGVAVSGNMAGSLINSGTISVFAQTNGATPAVEGIHVGGDISGSLSNSGSISARVLESTNSGRAEAWAIRAMGGLSGTLSNSGSISADAAVTPNTSTIATAYGVDIGTVAGTLTNNGSIAASAKVFSSFRARAYGIRQVASLTGTVVNNGTIQAMADNPGSTKEKAYGIWGLSMAAGSMLNNRGLVASTVFNGVNNTSNSKALNIVGSTGGTVNNQAGGILRGNISVSGTAAVNNAGMIDIPADSDFNRPTNSVVDGTYTQQTGGILRIGAST